jgi:four helix bundle protein
MANRHKEEIAMGNYRDLKVWEKAHHLTLTVYAATRAFRREELYGLTSQVRRAAASVPANIAEGRGRYGKAEFGRFLQIALGSACELDYHLLLARDLTYLPYDEHRQLGNDLDEIRAMLVGLIQRLTPHA